MQDLSKQNSDKNPFFPVRICVLPQVASWGKGVAADVEYERQRKLKGK